jgi:UDP-GlcNAc:undecaprenyl-phosphate GlcNAc-1-phosphate transferase
MSAVGPIAGSVAFVLCMILVPIAMRLCHRWRLLDPPGPLKIHSQPIPRLGGVAIVIAIFSTSCFEGFRSALPTWPFFAAMALIWAVGLADDVRNLSPLSRLAAQVAAAIVLWSGGWHLPALVNTPVGEAFNLGATCVFVVALVNALNLLDGSDGLAAGVAAIIAAAYAAFPGAVRDPFAVSVAWSFLGACAGFLLFNFPPARIFLGDSGSTVLGFGVAFLGLDFYRSNSAIGTQWFFPFFVAGLPLLDALLAVIRRLRSRGSPVYGDRAHIYDLVMARGWSPRRVALVCYAITFVLAADGWLGVRGGLVRFVVVSALTLGALLAAATHLGALRTTSPNQRSAARTHRVGEKDAGSLA